MSKGPARGPESIGDFRSGPRAGTFAKLRGQSLGGVKSQGHPDGLEILSWSGRAPLRHVAVSFSSARPLHGHPAVLLWDIAPWLRRRFNRVVWEGLYAKRSGVLV